MASHRIIARALAPLAAVALVALTGCGHQRLMDTMDEGLAFEATAEQRERERTFPDAADLYAKCAVKLEEALAIAEERQNIVFVSFLEAKLSIVSTARGRCIEPDRNAAGSWDEAVAMHVRSAEWATRGRFLKMLRNAIAAQASCARPDRNAAGSWERAALLYAEAASKSEEIKDEHGRGEDLRNQAICLVHGDTNALTPEARKLLEKARKLGDERATDILDEGSAGETYCTACGAGMPAGSEFCPGCGRKRTDPKKPGPDDDRPLRPPGSGGPGAPGQ